MGRTGDEPAAGRKSGRGRGSARGRRAVAVLVAVAALASCGGGDDGDDGARAADAQDDGGPTVENDELRRELLDMQADDQAERTGEVPDDWNDRERTERLAEIVDEHGWPGHDLVGEDGASAAWLIAQHSDLDVDFQERALELMRAAVADGQADPSELAYLEDRVALNQGRPQVYGTQIGCVGGRAEAAEMEEPEGVDERRAEVGLPPLDDYLAELEDECAAEAEAAPPAEP